MKWQTTIGRPLASYSSRLKSCSLVLHGPESEVSTRADCREAPNGQSWNDFALTLSRRHKISITVRKFEESLTIDIQSTELRSLG